MNYLTNKRNWAPLTDLRREVDRLFEDFWPDTAPAKGLRDFEAQWSPACDVEEAADHYLISLELAGVPKDQVKVEAHDNQVVISGERRQETKKQEGGQRYSERTYGRFQRSFALPAGVNIDRVEAQFQDGVLRVLIPKAEAARPRQIRISDGGPGLLGRVLGQKRAPDVPSPDSKSA